MVAGPYGRDPSDPVRLVGTVAAVLSIAAGVIHISAAGDHTDLPVMFAGFMIVATLQVALGGLLLWRRPSKLLIAAALALMVSSIGMWLLSRTSGLPFLEGGHLEPVGFKDGVTKLFELGSHPGAAPATQPRPRRGRRCPRRGSEARRSACCGAGVFALMTPALLLDGGTQHSHEQAVAMGIHEHGEAGGARRRRLGGGPSARRRNSRTKATKAQWETTGMATATRWKPAAGTITPGRSLRARSVRMTPLAPTTHSGSDTHRDSHGGGAPMDDVSHNENSGGNQHNAQSAGGRPAR